MPRIHTIDMQRLTPLGRIIAEYMRQQWPRLQTKAELAEFVGVRPSTIDNVMYSEHVPSSRTLNKIAHATGIPAARLYEAASLSTRPAPLPMPVPRRAEQDPAPRLVEQQSPYAARDTYIRRIEGLHLDPATKQELIDMFLAALPAEAPAGSSITAPRSALRDRLNNEEHNHDFIETLEHPTAPPAHTAAPNAAHEPQAESQAESHPAGTYSAIRR